MIVNYRKEWFNHVAKERRRLQRKDKKATHRQAMAAASVTWPKQKAKLQRKAAREAKKTQRAESSSKAVQPTPDSTASTE